MADKNRLIELSMVPALAAELASQINGPVRNVDRLTALSMVPGVAREINSQIISGTGNANRLIELGVVPRLAREISIQIGGTPTPTPGQTPDGPEEAVISPANTTLRSTYAMTKVGSAYAFPISEYNGNGVYWPNKPRRLPVPNPKYPDLFISYSTPDHGTGDSGIFAYLCNGDPFILTNWRSYDDVKANTDWLSHLTGLPAANPIYIGPRTPGSGAQTETICIIPFNGKLVFFFQMQTPFSPAYANQSTARAVTTDGFNFTGQNIAILQRGDSVGDGHEGYFTGGANPFPNLIDPGTGVKALYAGWSLNGGQSRSTTALWATDNPETGTWRRVQTFGKTIGRNAIGTTGNWMAFAFINMDWGSIRQTRQGWSFITEGAARGSGATARPGDLYEVLVGDDGRTMLGKPQLFLARGGSGTIDQGEVAKGELFVFGNERGIIYEAATSSNVKVAAIARGPLRNPQNTWFDPLTPAIPAFTTKQIDFTAVSAIPAGYTAITAGAPSISYSAAGAAVALASGDKYYLFEDVGFDPATTDYVDIYLDDFISTAGTGSRIPYIGFATGKAVRSAMTDAFYLTNADGSGLLAYASLVGGAETKRSSDYVYGIGYATANGSGTTNARKHKGIRWFPKSNEAYVLEEGAEGEPMRSSAANYPALLDKTKRYYPFIAFEADGANPITEQLGKMIVRVADTGSTAVTLNDLTLANTTPEVNSLWISAIIGKAAGEAVTFSASDGTTLTACTSDGTPSATGGFVKGTFTTAGSKSITMTGTLAAATNSPHVSPARTVTVSAALTQATVTKTALATSTSNATTYNFAGQAIGAAASDRYIIVGVTGRSSSATTAATCKITPAGGSQITMTLLDQQNSGFDAPAETSVWLFGALVPAGTTGDIVVTHAPGLVRAGIEVFALTGVNGLTPAATAKGSTVRSTVPNSPAVTAVNIDRKQKGVTLAVGVYSTTSTTLQTAAYEETANSASGAAVSLSVDNNGVLIWTGLANTEIGTQLEATGSAGQSLLVATWAPVGSA